MLAVERRRMWQQGFQSAFVEIVLPNPDNGRYADIGITPIMPSAGLCRMA
jgi:hypothetical protein